MPNLPRSRVRPRLIGLILALIAVGLTGAACAPATLPPSAATNAPAPTVAQPTTVADPVKPVANTPIAVQPGNKAALPVGVDADGNFYRGNPNAPVKLIDFSDFQ